MLLSEVAKSNLFTKAVAVQFDPRQAVPTTYQIPNEDTRLLLARLIYEEAMETIHALGCQFNALKGGIVSNGVACNIADQSRDINLDDMIDGCCDTIYVAVGALCAMGAPDVPHLLEVCEANNRKFPKGIATMDPDTGKYLKPPGWKGPDHKAIREDLEATFNLNGYGKSILHDKQEEIQ